MIVRDIKCGFGAKGTLPPIDYVSMKDRQLLRFRDNRKGHGVFIKFGV